MRPPACLAAPLAALLLGGLLAACGSGDEPAAPPGWGGSAPGGSGSAAAGGAAGTGGSAGEAGGGADPCAGAPLGDGTYCGSSLDPPGHANVLYECQAGATTASTPCEFGCAAKPPGTPDECAPDPASIPRGKGVWIWKFGTSAPPPAEVAAKADSLGVGFVLIKSGEDLSAYESNFNAQIVAEFTSRDMWVFAWNYVRPGNVPAKAAKIAQQTNIAGVKGMVLDVEIEWESTGAEQDAIDLCQAIRSQLEPDKMLGFSSFGWIDYHLGFPYAEFDAHCGDMHLPQTYWDAWSIGREQAYLKAVEGAKKLGLSAPIWAAQDFYEGDPTVEELNYFFALAGPFSNLWRWPNPGHTDLLEKMEQLDWPNY